MVAAKLLILKGISRAETLDFHGRRRILCLMNIETQRFLVNYVIQLIVTEGMTAVHSTTVIPTRRNLSETRAWTQFVNLDESLLRQLNEAGIEYNHHDGWFRKEG